MEPLDPEVGDTDSQLPPVVVEAVAVKVAPADVITTDCWVGVPPTGVMNDRALGDAVTLPVPPPPTVRVTVTVCEPRLLVTPM